MKKLLLAVVGALLLAPAIACADYIANVSPGVTIASSSVTGINYSKVKVKMIVVNQPGTVAQTVTFYDTATTTTSATSRFTATIPGTVGEYYPIGTTPLGWNSSINMPYFTVLTSTNVTPVNVNVIYDR